MLGARCRVAEACAPRRPPPDRATAVRLRSKATTVTSARYSRAARHAAAFLHSMALADAAQRLLCRCRRIGASGSPLRRLPFVARQVYRRMYRDENQLWTEFETDLDRVMIYWRKVSAPAPPALARAGHPSVAAAAARRGTSSRRADDIAQHHAHPAGTAAASAPEPGVRVRARLRSAPSC